MPVWVSRLLKSALVLLGVGVAVVAASGLWLSFRYEPPALDVTTNPIVLRAGGGWVKDVHVAAGWISLIAAAAIVVGLAVDAARRRASWAAASAMTAVLATMLVAVFSGRRLPWIQVALRAVTVGEQHRGVWWVASNDVRFVLIPAGEVAAGRYRMWLVLHVVVVPVVSAAAGVFAVVANRRDRDRHRANAVLVDAP